jgi:hypothetical protein
MPRVAKFPATPFVELARVAQNTVLVLAYVFLWLAALVVIRADPFRVIEWWAD